MTWEQCRKNTCHRHQRCMYLGNPWWCGEEKAPTGDEPAGVLSQAPAETRGGQRADAEGGDLKNGGEKSEFPPVRDDATLFATIIGGVAVYYVQQTRDPFENPVGHNPPHSDWLWFDGPNGYNDWCNEPTFPPGMIVPQYMYDDLKALGKEKGYIAAPPLPEHKDRKPAKRHHPVPKTPRRFRP